MDKNSVGNVKELKNNGRPDGDNGDIGPIAINGYSFFLRE